MSMGRVATAHRHAPWDVYCGWETRRQLTFESSARAIKRCTAFCLASLSAWSSSDCSEAKTGARYESEGEGVVADDDGVAIANTGYATMASGGSGRTDGVKRTLAVVDGWCGGESALATCGILSGLTRV